MRCGGIKTRLITIIIICILTLSGCQAENGSIYSNYRDVARLLPVEALGADSAPDGVLLSVASGAGTKSGPPLCLSRSGPGIAKAMEELQDFAGGQELFYDHSKYLLIGRAAVEEGIEPYLSFIERSTELRLGIRLFLVKDGQAAALMGACSGEDYDICSVMDSLSRDIKMRGESHAFTCGETAKALAERGCALICAVSSAEATNSVLSRDVPVTVKADGFAVLSGGRLAAFISAQDAPAACMLTGHGGAEELVLPDGEGGRFTAIIYNYKTELEPEYGNDGSMKKAKLTVKAEAGVLESDSGEVPERSGELLAELMEQRIRNVLNISQELGADFLALGGKLRAKDPRAFDAMGKSWEDSLKELEIEIELDCSIGRSYDLRSDAQERY